jgi:serine/threonine protein kinase
VAATFDGNERFAVEEAIGQGGMGVVYRAFDRERDVPVALKLLRKLNPLAIYRFKREFRTIAEITHPNLVSLYELVNAGDDWFFTMELVDGRTFLDYVRGAAPPPGANIATPTSDFRDTPTTRVRAPIPLPPATATRPLDSAAQYQRLRSALGQLAHGVAALHEAGHLHRDIKPPNIMVTRNGRVVLLDFGIVRALSHERGQGDDDAIVGTPAYMAPEQAAGDELTEASDWYSVGVVMFEAITGRRPFQSVRRFNRETEREYIAKALSKLPRGLPEDIEALCFDLLARDPHGRPRGDEVLARLGARAETATARARSRSVETAAQQPLIGRSSQLAQLDSAFLAAQRGEQRTVFVHGASGMGKTALVRFFLAGLRGTQRAVVLSGRCYERESVPHKALDSLVDGLTRHLLTMSPHVARHAMPRYAGALARLFPVLKRVRALRRAPGEGLALAEPGEVRRRAFAAFRELLDNLCAIQPVVMYIDDVQWGDADSAALLAEAIRPPSPPPFLLVLSYRSEDAASSEFLRTLSNEPHNSSELPLGGLTDIESRELAEALIAQAGHGDDEFDVDGIAREARGSPFFVGELVRFLVETGSTRGYTWVQRGVRLREVLGSRVADLPESARRMLEASAVAGRPLPQALIRRVAGVGTDAASALAMLRNRNLVRTRGPRDDDAIEPYHDRVRETVAAALSDDERRMYCRELAAALHETGEAEPEAVAGYLVGAGEPERAAKLYELAAGTAEDSLGFERAATLYRRALELRPREGKSAAALRAKIGAALANAGRGAEAADAYLEATGTASEQHALDYRMLAAEQLLRSGHMDEGLAILRQVLAAVGLKLPASQRRALLGLFGWRLRIRMRGPGIEEGESPAAPEDLMRVRVCWSAASSLAMSDPVRGAYFQARHLLYALDAGDPSHASRALAIEACYLSLRGPPAEKVAMAIAARAREIAARIDDPLAMVWSEAADGLIAFGTERWQDARDAVARAWPLLHDRCIGTAYEIHATQMFRVFALYYLGELGELAREVPQWLREAVGRGDVYAATDLRSGLANLAWLTADDPAGARVAADAAKRGWRPEGFHLQHYWDMLAHEHIRLYQGYGDAAFRDLQERWRRLRRSHLLRVHMVRNEALHLRARCALAAVRGADDSAIGVARRDARALDRIDTRCSRAFARLVRAGVAGATGHAEDAADGLRGAIAACQAAEMWLFETAARRRLGVLLGGDEGAEHVRVADDWYTSRAVANPERMTAMLAPGFG